MVVMEKLIQVLSSMVPLTNEFKWALEKEAIHLSLPKNYFLLEAPEIPKYAFFLETGFAVSFSFVKGRKRIEKFWTGGQVVLSSQGFFERTPAVEFIQLMQPSEVVHFSHNGLMNLFSSFDEANTIYRTIISGCYAHCRERLLDMKNLSTSEQYRKLILRFASVEQIVPQEYIASYLGITPQSLSRLKRRLGRT